MAVREAKARTLGFEEDRDAAYREWHYSLGPDTWAINLDQVEFRRSPKGSKLPAGVVELKRFDTDGPVETWMLDKVLGLLDAGLQGDALRYIAAALGVPAWLVVYRHDLTGFWVYNLTARRGWFPADDDGTGYGEYQYRVWLGNMAAT